MVTYIGGIIEDMSMDPPNRPYPSPPATSITSTPAPMPLFIPDPSIRGENFDQLLAQRGVRMIHHRALPCPNLDSTSNNAHPANCEFCNSSGIIYYDSREIWGVFQGNSQEKVFEAHGVWEMGSAVVSFPSEYPDGTQADFQTYDKIEIPDFTMRLFELKEYEPRPDGQQLRYPVQKVDYVVSISNGTRTTYQVGVDFNITESGKIEWVDGRQPYYNDSECKGDVIAYAYYAKPVYIVLQSLRELRITQQMINGIKQAKRLPQQVLVKKQFLSEFDEKIYNHGDDT